MLIILGMLENKNKEGIYLQATFSIRCSEKIKPNRLSWFGQQFFAGRGETKLKKQRPHIFR